MITVTTHQGKRVEIVLESELRSPVEVGAQVRAYCHIHGSDHQRSLSITKATGWGHCFNAACGATVLVVEWNRAAAKHLLRLYYRGLTSAALPSYHAPFSPPIEVRRRPLYIQPLLLSPPKPIPLWQQEERETLCAMDERLRRSLVVSPRARLYLHERGIPLEVAQTTGVGYLPATLLNEPQLRQHRGVLQRWAERMIFPLHSPDGRGYIGRSLWRWQPGMDETTHKALLERRGSPKRWIKTNPAGWFGSNCEQGTDTLLLVEGVFDRLTLLAAGFSPEAIVALVGTALPLDWLPFEVKRVVLALDGDAGGKEASNRLCEQLMGRVSLSRSALCHRTRGAKIGTNAGGTWAGRVSLRCLRSFPSQQWREHDGRFFMTSALLEQCYFSGLTAAIKRNIGRRVSSRMLGSLSSISCVG